MDFTEKLNSFLVIAENLLLAPGSSFSLTSLACAFVLAFGYMVWRRARRGRKFSLRVIAAGLFPKRIWKSDSMAADIRLFLLNAFIMGSIFGWAMMSFHVVGEFVSGALISAFGQRSPAPFPEYVSRGIVTLTLFLAYEFAYWLDHYLSHRVPFLWEFHKVHHSAEHLTPLTVWRMHPMNSVFFGNMTALILAIVNALVCYLLGANTVEFTITGTNVILVLFVHLYLHLQHSHIWISFQGWLGRTLLSPAHHQIHHSMNPAHFNKNLGSCLAIWDWMFGTLYVPAKEPEKLEFGIEADGDVNTITAGLITPFVDAGRQLAHLVSGAPAAPAQPAEGGAAKNA